MRIVFPKIFSVRNKISQDSGLRPSSWEILFLTSKIFGNIIFSENSQICLFILRHPVRLLLGSLIIIELFSLNSWSKLLKYVIYLYALKKKKCNLNVVKRDLSFSQFSSKRLHLCKENLFPKEFSSG